MNDAFTRSSKLVSLVLRHKPQEFGITLDRYGFTPVDSIRALLKKQGLPSTVEDVHALVTGRDKQRFELSEDLERIRATHGHSVPIDLGPQESKPPPELFHGATLEDADRVLAQGLQPHQRQYVHLSLTREVAAYIAKRRGTPVVIRIDSEAMHRDGLRFFHSPGDVWRTESVPPRYLTRETS